MKGNNVTSSVHTKINNIFYTWSGSYATSRPEHTIIYSGGDRAGDE